MRSWRGLLVTHRGRGHGPAGPSGYGSGYGSRPRYDRVRDPSRPFRARTPRSRARGPCCPAARRTIWISLPVGHPARPDALIAPTGVAEIDESASRTRPAAARGRPTAPSRTARYEKTTQRFVAVYIRILVYKISNAEPLGVGHRGPSARKWGQRITPGEANGWRAGCPISLKFCRGPPESAEAKRPHDLIDPHPIAFNIRFGIYAGNAACCPSRGSAVLDSADGRALALVAGRVREGNTVYRHCADGCNRDVGPRWMAYPQAAGRVGKTGTLSTTAARSGPPQRVSRGNNSQAQLRRLQPQDLSHCLPPRLASTLPPDRRPAPRYHASPRRGGEPDRQAFRS